MNFYPRIKIPTIRFFAYRKNTVLWANKKLAKRKQETPACVVHKIRKKPYPKVNGVYVKFKLKDELY